MPRHFSRKADCQPPAVVLPKFQVQSLANDEGVSQQRMPTGNHAKVKTIGVVNGGGDAPGLNAVIRGVVHSAINAHGMRVIGVSNGFDGLIWPEGSKDLTEESVSGILPRGGTILGTTFGDSA